MRRREFVGALGGAAVWLLAGHAQQSERMRRVGVLINWRESDPFSQGSVAAFAQALARSGWVEGTPSRFST
jgi:putative ABC transport system substrate-binding protein